MAILVLSSSPGMWSRFSKMVLVAVTTIPETEAISKQNKDTSKSNASYRWPYDWCQLRRRRQLVVAAEPCTLWVQQIQCRIDWALHAPIDRQVGCTLDPSQKVEELRWSYCTCCDMQHLHLQDNEKNITFKDIDDIPVPSIDELDIGINVSSATATASNGSRWRRYARIGRKMNFRWWSLEIVRFRRRSEEIGSVELELFLARSHLSKLIGKSINWGLAAGWTQVR